MNEELERRQFEKWVQDGNQTSTDLVYKRNGEYFYQATHTAWQSWKGRAGLVSMEEDDAETPAALEMANKALASGIMERDGDAEVICRQLLRAHERIAKLKDALRGSIDPKAPLEELRGTFPLVVYFGGESDRDELMFIMQELKPGLVQRKI